MNSKLGTESGLPIEALNYTDSPVTRKGIPEACDLTIKFQREGGAPLAAEPAKKAAGVFSRLWSSNWGKAGIIGGAVLATIVVFRATTHRDPVEEKTSTALAR